jgi:hypothetical protein
MMATPVNQRVQKRREAMRAQGLRPVQLWLPDTSDPTFRAKLAEEGRRIAEADAKDVELQQWMDATLDETLADLDRIEAEDDRRKQAEEKK